MVGIFSCLPSGISLEEVLFEAAQHEVYAGSIETISVRGMDV